MSRPSKNKEFVAPENCALCRGQFPIRVARGHNAWRSHFRALLCPDPTNENDIEVTELAVHRDFGLSIQVPLVGCPRDETVTISRSTLVLWKGLKEINHSTVAFCVHGWCYSILLWKIPGCSTSVAYKLIRSLVPNPLIWENIIEDATGREYCLDQVGTLKTLAAHFRSFGTVVQMPALLELPMEITSRICEYVGGSTPYSAFVIVAGEISRLSALLHPPGNGEIVLRRGCYITAKMTTVFEREYIQDLVYSKDSEKKHQVIGPVQEVKFVANIGGICAVRLVGPEWETDWIGKFPTTGHNWHWSIRGSVDILRFDYNGLQCVENIWRPEPRLSCQLVWDQSDFPSSLVEPELELAGRLRSLGGFNQSSSGTPQRRFFRFLNLFLGDEYITGLTVYTNFGIMVGLEAHFRQTSRLLGFRIGCPQYFPLLKNERIAYIWLHTDDYHGETYSRQFLDIQTTLRRSFSFGRYIRQEEMLRHDWKWILLKSKGCVSGFYFENSRYPKSTKRLGITYDDFPKGHYPPTLQYYASASGHSRIDGLNHLFLSVGTFNDFRKVDLCRRENRCTGMLVQHLSGTTAVLGQWYSPDVSQHSCIHDGDQLDITRIYFQMSKSKGKLIVTDIGFLRGLGETTPGPTSLVFNIETPLAWWFSYRYDEVVPWTGSLLHVY